jgi:hypothetical protein
MTAISMFSSTFERIHGGNHELTGTHEGADADESGEDGHARQRVRKN